MKKWYKCPRCIRYCVLPSKKGYKCHECLMEFTKEQFNKLSKKEFGSVEFDIETQEQRESIEKLAKTK